MHDRAGTRSPRHLLPALHVAAGGRRPGHDAAIFLFGMGYGHLDKHGLGMPVGYPAFMSFAIIVGNIHGFRTGEWKGASKQSIQWIIAGIIVLIIGVSVLGVGHAIQ